MPVVCEGWSGLESKIARPKGPALPARPRKRRYGGRSGGWRHSRCCCSPSDVRPAAGQRWSSEEKARVPGRERTGRQEAGSSEEGEQKDFPEMMPAP